MSRCTEKILTQLEVHANVVGEKEEEEELLMEADRSWTFQVKSIWTICQVRTLFLIKG